MTLHEFITLQRREIERHKWIESQKAGHDLGDQAVFDWVMRYSEDFKRYVAEVLGEKVCCTPIGDNQKGPQTPPKSQSTIYEAKHI